MSDGSGRPHVEITDVYHWVVSERGEEFERRSTSALGQLLYWVFEAATSAMARDWEVKHRRISEDFRRQWFARHVELMSMLDPCWGRILAAEHDVILQAHPFDDD